MSASGAQGLGEARVNIGRVPESSWGGVPMSTSGA